MGIFRKCIGLDFDDLLFDCMSSVARWHNRCYGTNYSRDDMNTYDLWAIWKVSKDEAYRRFREFYLSPEHARMQPVPGATVAVPMLLTQTDVRIISARPELARAETLELLEEHFPSLVDHLYLTGGGAGRPARKKSEVCRELGLNAFADDAEHHHRDVTSVIPDTYLFRSPWSASYAETLPRGKVVTSWYGLGAKLVL